MRPHWTAPLLLMILVLAGCAGSSEPTSTPVPPLPTAEVDWKVTPEPESYESVRLRDVSRVSRSPKGAGFTATYPYSPSWNSAVEIMDILADSSKAVAFDSHVDTDKTGRLACGGGKGDPCLYDSQMYSVEVSPGKGTLQPFFCDRARPRTAKLGGEPAKEYRCTNIREFIATYRGRSYKLTVSGDYTKPLRQLAREFIASFRFTT